MNCFAHGRPFLEDAYFLAGTSLPDWLVLVDRKVRVRAKSARLLIHEVQPQVRAIARGIVQHHQDDDWFHQTRAFVELSLELALHLRQLLAGDDGFRPSFLAHITIEMLLDAQLAIQQPKLLDEYYRQLATIDPQLVQAVVNRISVRSTGRLAGAIPMILRDAYVYDYLDDRLLLLRLNRILRRLGLPRLPDSAQCWIVESRNKVAARQRELLIGHQTPARVA